MRIGVGAEGDDLAVVAEPPHVCERTAAELDAALLPRALVAAEREDGVTRLDDLVGPDREPLDLGAQRSEDVLGDGRRSDLVVNGMPAGSRQSILSSIAPNTAATSPRKNAP